jgi:hypothetical protein
MERIYCGKHTDDVAFVKTVIGKLPDDLVINWEKTAEKMMMHYNKEDQVDGTGRFTNYYFTGGEEDGNGN